MSQDFRQKRAVKAGVVILTADFVVNPSLTFSPRGSPLLFPFAVPYGDTGFWYEEWLFYFSKQIHLRLPRKALVSCGPGHSLWGYSLSTLALVFWNSHGKLKQLDQGICPCARCGAPLKANIKPLVSNFSNSNAPRGLGWLARQWPAQSLWSWGATLWKLHSPGPRYLNLGKNFRI